MGGAARPKAPATAPLLEVERPLEIILEAGIKTTEEVLGSCDEEDRTADISSAGFRAN
jgi:hypothetical protein